MIIAVDGPTRPVPKQRIASRPGTGPNPPNSERLAPTAEIGKLTSIANLSE